MSALRARVIALVIIFPPTVMLTICDELVGEIRKVVVAVFAVHVEHAAEITVVLASSCFQVLF